jgi:hypothetical protein
MCTFAIQGSNSRKRAWIVRPTRFLVFLASLSTPPRDDRHLRHRLQHSTPSLSQGSPELLLLQFLHIIRECNSRKCNFSSFVHTLRAKSVTVILSPTLAGFIFHGEELRFILRLLNERAGNKRLHVSQLKLRVSSSFLYGAETED